MSRVNTQNNRDLASKATAVQAEKLTLCMPKHSIVRAEIDTSPQDN